LKRTLTTKIRIIAQGSRMVGPHRDYEIGLLPTTGDTGLPGQSPDQVGGGQ
jgi:hypothetical protein